MQKVFNSTSSPFRIFFFTLSNYRLKGPKDWVVYPLFSPMCFVSYCRRQRRKRATKPCRGRQFHVNYLDWIHTPINLSLIQWRWKRIKFNSRTAKRWNAQRNGSNNPMETEKIQGNLGSLWRKAEQWPWSALPHFALLSVGSIFPHLPAQERSCCRRPSPLAFPFPSKQPEIEETSAWDNLLIFFEWPACFLLSCWLREKGKKRKKLQTIIEVESFPAIARQEKTIQV